jgi:predicted acetyltransferase
MFELVTPHRRFHRSFLAAADEHIAAGEEHNTGILAWPADDQFTGKVFTLESLESPEVFAELARVLADDRLPDSPRPAGFVPSTNLWMVDGAEYLGRISVRHELTEHLLEFGGHIGYSVRPSARRRGYASSALAMVMPICAELGIEDVLVTCDDDNVASRRAIERNGGVLEDKRGRKLRFWIPSGDRTPA